MKQLINKQKLNILLYGDSASSHLMAASILKSNKLNKLFIFGKNEFVKSLGIPVNINDCSLVNFAKNNDIDLFICDSEINIQGITSLFKKNGMLTIGVPQKWARLEGSKLFGKKFANRFNIPIPNYIVVADAEKLIQDIDSYTFPMVIKADGYAKGIGTCIAYDKQKALRFLYTIKQNEQLYKNCSSKIIIEDLKIGEEISYVCIWTGSKLVPCAYIKDYKKLSSNIDINTASMGAFYSPNILSDKKIEIIKSYHNKLEKALIELKADFTGPIYSGLMLTDSSYWLLEYNMRFGTTESHILFSNLTTDFIDFALQTALGKLSKFPFNYEKTIYCSVLYPKGYPFEYSISKIRNEVFSEFKKEFPEIQLFFNKILKYDNYYILNESSCIYLIDKTTNSNSRINTSIKKFFAKDTQYRDDIGV